MANKKQKPSQPTDYTVDAVYVVRCKECQHYFDYGNGVYGCRTFGMMKPKPEGFCSYGERRTKNGK